MKYRKKPVVIEAELFNNETKDRVLNFIGCNCYPKFNSDNEAVLVIETLEGNMTASDGDYIIKGIKGEFHPCKPDIFHATYEKVD